MLHAFERYTHQGQRAKGIAGILATLVVGVIAFSPIATAQTPAWAADRPGAAHSAALHYTDEGTEACLFCHSSDRMKLISETPHADTENPDSPLSKQGCESCHGPGSLHVSRSRRGKGRPPMIDFREESKTPVDIQNEACLECHAKGGVQGEEGFVWKGSIHAQEDVTCSDCHSIHATEEPLKNQESQATICYVCHENTAQEHPNFEDVGIDWTRLACWDCHAVHDLLPEEEEQTASAR
jgi:DmsE family decaheme c-type cytochrome